MPHSALHHPEFPLEKGKALDPKSKLIMNVVRDTILPILRGESVAPIKKYTKEFNWNKPPDTLGKRKVVNFDISQIQGNISTARSTPEIKRGVKDGVHLALEAVGIHTKNTDKRIRIAIETLGGQYKIMSEERFVHRLENGKIERDAIFLLGMVRYMSQIGNEGMASIVRGLFSDANYPGFDDSDSMKALKYLIKKGKSTLKNQSKKGSYKEFKKMILRLAISY